jgi:hypothetical protein
MHCSHFNIQVWTSPVLFLGSDFLPLDVLSFFSLPSHGRLLFHARLSVSKTIVWQLYYSPVRAYFFVLIVETVSCHSLSEDWRPQFTLGAISRGAFVTQPEAEIWELPWVSSVSSLVWGFLSCGTRFWAQGLYHLNHTPALLLWLIFRWCLTLLPGHPQTTILLLLSPGWLGLQVRATRLGTNSLLKSEDSEVCVSFPVPPLLHLTPDPQSTGQCCPHSRWALPMWLTDPCGNHLWKLLTDTPKVSAPISQVSQSVSQVDTKTTPSLPLPSLQTPYPTDILPPGCLLGYNSFIYF